VPLGGIAAVREFTKPVGDCRAKGILGDVSRRATARDETGGKTGHFGMPIRRNRNTSNKVEASIGRKYICVVSLDISAKKQPCLFW
jgi:hypothetical protein